MNLDGLALKVANHDKVAFEELYVKLNRIVFAVVLGIVKSKALAEEIMQDTFVTVWSQSSAFRGKGYKTWIITIARNKALNLIKQTQREISLDFSKENFIASSYEHNVENGIILNVALKHLSTEERQIVLMYNAGLKMKEISLILNMPRGTVSWKYSEALKKLKILLEGVEK